jgi:hypothetical protein
MDEDLKKKFFDFGALRYSAKKIASILQVPLADADTMLKGDYAAAFESGANSFDYAIDKKLMEMALGGDLKALQKLEAKR